MLFTRSACLKEVPTISYSLIYGQVFGEAVLLKYWWMLVLLTSLLKRFVHLFKACLQIRWLDTETGFTPILQSKLFLVLFVVKF